MYFCCCSQLTSFTHSFCFSHLKFLHKSFIYASICIEKYSGEIVCVVFFYSKERAPTLVTHVSICIHRRTSTATSSSVLLNVRWNLHCRTSLSPNQPCHQEAQIKLIFNLTFEYVNAPQMYIFFNIVESSFSNIQLLF